jgi:hypothetical protein
MWIYKASGGELVRPDNVLVPASGACVLMAALPKSAAALISITFLILACLAGKISVLFFVRVN